MAKGAPGSRGRKVATVQFLIMVKSNPTSLAHWATMSEAEQAEFGRAHFALTDSLLDSGVLVTSAGLAPVEYTHQVRLTDGAVVTTDGPFAEVKEHLAGFYLVDVPDLEAAVQIAARVPDAAWNAVEVRPVFDRKWLDE
jgi:hypothetical protein